jgi:hypothetical protein
MRDVWIVAAPRKLAIVFTDVARRNRFLLVGGRLISVIFVPKVGTPPSIAKLLDPGSVP